MEQAQGKAEEAKLFKEAADERGWSSKEGEGGGEAASPALASVCQLAATVQLQRNSSSYVR